MNPYFLICIIILLAVAGLVAVIVKVRRVLFSRTAGGRFIEAASAGDCDTISLLLRQAVDVRTRTPFGRETALHKAAAGGHLEVVRMLLDHGAEVNEAYGGNATALYLAVRAGHTQLVHLLLTKGADPNIESEGITPLYVAAKNNRAGIVQLLLNSGAEFKGGSGPWAGRGLTPEVVRQMVKDALGAIEPKKCDLCNKQRRGISKDFVVVEVKRLRSSPDITHWQYTVEHETTVFVCNKCIESRTKCPHEPWFSFDAALARLEEAAEEKCRKDVPLFEHYFRPFPLGHSFYDPRDEIDYSLSRYTVRTKEQWLRDDAESTKK